MGFSDFFPNLWGGEPEEQSSIQRATHRNGKPVDSLGDLP